MKISQTPAIGWLLSIGFILPNSGLAYDFQSVGAFQRGSWEVWVANPPAPPAPKEAFQAQVVLTIPSTESHTTKNITVPAGKRLTIEYINAVSDGPINQKIDFVVTAKLPGSSQVQAVPLALLAHSGPSADIYIANQTVTLFAGPGDSVTVFVQKSPSGSGVVNATFSIAGHLEPAG